MFKSLKEKLKGWISKTKEETEEEVVETQNKIDKEEKQKSKKIIKKQTEKKTPPKEKKATNKKEPKEDKPSEKKKKEKTTEELSEELAEKIEDKLEEEVKETTEELKETIEKVEEIKKEKTTEEETEKKGFFSSLFSRKKDSKEEEEKLTEKEPKKQKEEPSEEFLEKIEQKNEKELEQGVYKEPKKEFKTTTLTTQPQIEETEKKQTFSLFKRKGLTKEKFEELFDELELILLQNNVAYEAINNIKNSLKEKLVGESIKTDIEQALKDSIKELLINPPNLIEQIKTKGKKPFVILFAGINGAGKTTTIAKVAHLLKKNDFSVCLASADTFRAAAIEQLQVHADKLEIPLIKKDYGADPASVGFDAIKYAEKNKIDVVLIDTAGRMNNRDSLMKEIEKISRVNSPDLKIFLGESITGNDATEQAKDFNQAISIDGIILSKADVDEKGGTAISVAQVTGKPIYFLGTGQTYDDLETFDREKLIEKIFS